MKEIKRKTNVRLYGEKPFGVVLVHGGPGAAGEMEPVAVELSKNFGVLEPFQTKNSINLQIKELKNQIIKFANPPVVLLGYSWGAWLSLILASKCPSLVDKLILVGSGPMEEKYANKIMPTRLSHLNSEDKLRVSELLVILQKGKATDLDLSEFGSLMSKADSYYPVSDKNYNVKVQADIYQKVWGEAEVLRSSGKLLDYAKNLKCQVVVIHGDYDPHPFEGVKIPLSKTLKIVKFHLLENCGHPPWRERRARNSFYKMLNSEIKGNVD